MNEQILDALKRARYRVLTGPEEREELYRLRYRCYIKEKAIVPNEGRRMTDPFDQTPNCVNVAVELDGEMLAGVRLHLVTQSSPMSPSLEVFPELEEHVKQGMTILDPTRFVVDPDARQQRVPLHFLALRIPMMAAIFYHVDLALAPVRPEHAAFYSRYLGYQVHIGPRVFPGLQKATQLMVADFEKHRAEVLKRTPSLGPIDGIPQSDIAFPILSELRIRKSGSSDAA